MDIAFLLNGDEVRLTIADGAGDAEGRGARHGVGATTTLLDWLRDERGLTGTKEGCNEGDCGACSVMVSAPGAPPKALNACILFLPQLHGKAVRTVEGLASRDGALHPVQSAMMAHHGAQCGFCTPGFVVTMAAAHAAGKTDHADQLAGNLCRCTGYAPILRAARAAEAAPVPAWIEDDPTGIDDAPAGPHGAAGARVALPQTVDELARWYADHPEATLVAGATDVGLWVTKGLRDLGPVAFLHRCRDLQRIEAVGDDLRIGAGVTIAALRSAVAARLPSLAELLRRYGSEQVRNAATLGGNIANGSPIGDSPPALIALGARLHLRHGDTRRSLPLEEFFLDYGKQDRAPGEFVEAVTLPGLADIASENAARPSGPHPLACYKLSKRFDQDISAVCGCFVIEAEEGRVRSARIAFGGMAATPRRAPAVERALTGAPWTEATVRAAMDAVSEDFTPIDDMRASAAYRLATARNMLARHHAERAGARVSVLDVTP